MSDPARSYFVNHGVRCEPRCYEIHIEATIQVRSGASVKLWDDDRNGLSTRNRDGDGVPIVIAGVVTTASSCSSMRYRGPLRADHAGDLFWPKENA